MSNNNIDKLLKKNVDQLQKDKKRPIAEKFNHSYNLINSSNDIKFYSGNKNFNKDNSNSSNILDKSINKTNLM